MVKSSPKATDKLKPAAISVHSGEVLLGIDIGTTSTKAILIDTHGHILIESSRPATLMSPEPGWAEENPEEWWHNLCELIPDCLAQAGLKAEQIMAIGVSGMVPTVILVDHEGNVIRPSIQQNDARAVEEIDFQRSQTASIDILERTGSPITQQSVGPKLLWLRKHESDNFSRARHVMGSYDFINYKLTGAFSIEHNWALESGLYDLQRKDWDDDLLRLAGISRDWVAPVREPSSVIGQVTSQAAQMTGLAAGTPVVAGSADHIASAFSAGLKANGDLLVKLGGAGDILYSLDHFKVDPNLYLDYHVIPGKYILNGCMASSGSLIKWFHKQFAPQQSYADLDAEAEALPAGANGLILLPYFLGEKTPINDPLARGTLVGLTLSHTRAHIFRAILEGIAYGFYHHLVILQQHGPRPKRGRVTNGGASSHLWKQITADVLGIPLEQIAQHPGSSLGAAFVAGMGIGAFSDWDEIERFIHISTITEPNLSNHAQYQELFPIYRATYEALKDQYPKLGRLSGRLE